MPIPPYRSLRAPSARPPDRTSAGGLRSTAELDNRVDALLEQPGWSPPLLPEVARALFDATSGGLRDVASAQNLLGLDPIVTARIMARAQSESGDRAPVRTVADTIDVLGPTGVAAFGFEMARQSAVFRLPGYLEVATGVRRHAQAAAAVSAMLAETIPHVALRPVDAWLRTFLVDVGLELALITATIPATPILTAWPAFRSARPRLGARALRAWGLPEPFADLAARQQLTADGTQPDSVLALVQLAGALVDDLGLTLAAGLPYAAADADPDQAFVAAEHVLGVHCTAIGALREDARALLSDMGLLDARQRRHATR